MTTLTHLAAAATSSLFSAVWESALLVLCVAVFLRLIPGITAAARSLIWAAVFLLTLVLPLARLTSASSFARPASASFQFDPRWALGVAALWATLSILRAIRLLQSAVLLRRIAGRSTPVEPMAEIAALLATAEPKVILCTSSEVDVPSVAGFFHRRILLPRSLAERIAPADLHQIVLHELEHLRRRDDWTNLVQKIALVVFPLHPALLWVERRLCLERELACDDEVLHATGGAAKAYATCLANLAEWSMLQHGLSLALGAWQRRSELARRVHRILHTPVRPMKPYQSAALATLILGAISGTAVLAAKSPQLISFNATPVSSFPAYAATIQPQSTRLHWPPFRANQARAEMAEPRLTPVALRVSRKHVQWHRTVVAGARRNAETHEVVLIEWLPDRAPRRTTVVQTFQLNYAVIPTRTGWLFFQL